MMSLYPLTFSYNYLLAYEYMLLRHSTFFGLVLDTVLLSILKNHDH